MENEGRGGAKTPEYFDEIESSKISVSAQGRMRGMKKFKCGGAYDPSLTSVTFICVKLLTNHEIALILTAALFPC